MMNRVYIVLAFCVSALYCTARNDWFDTPVSLDCGCHRIGTLPDGVKDATIHVRASASTTSGSEWGLVWDYIDDDNLSRAIISFPAIDKTEYIYKSSPSILIEKVAGGKSSTVYQGQLTADYGSDADFVSLKLVYEYGSAEISYGNTDQIAICQVPFDTSAAQVFIYCSDPVKCQRIQCSYNTAPNTDKSAFSDEASLVEYLKRSSDKVEGVWEYIDRSLNQDKAVLGGFYTFAVVRCGNAYDIVYLKGADVNRTKWQPLMIKGRLLPTIFEGNFDMQWIDSDCNLLSEDVNAQLSADAATLTLRFPLVGSEVRFRRLTLR